MKRWVAVVGVVALVLVVSVGAGYLWLSRPVEPAAWVEPGPSLESRQRASIVDTILAEHGVTDAAFVEGDEAAYVGYNAPTGEGAADAETLQFAAFLALMQAAPDAKTGVAVLHEADTPKLQWTGDLEALRAVGEDADKLEAWFASVEKKEL